MRRSRLAVPLAVPTVVLAAALGACGGSGGGDGGRTVQVTDGNISVEARDVNFDIGRIETSAGALDMTLIQRGKLHHTLVVEGVDGFKLAVNGEARDRGSVELSPGTYEYYCDVPGHRGQGMKGTLVVE